MRDPGWRPAIALALPVAGTLALRRSPQVTTLVLVRVATLAVVESTLVLGILLAVVLPGGLDGDTVIVVATLVSIGLTALAPLASARDAGPISGDLARQWRAGQLRLLGIASMPALCGLVGSLASGDVRLYAAGWILTAIGIARFGPGVGNLAAQERRRVAAGLDPLTPVLASS